MSKYNWDYKFVLPWRETLIITADWRLASSSIYYEDEDGDLVCTPFQVGDVQHNHWQALEVLLEWFGRDYWDNGSFESVQDVIDQTEIEDEE